MANDTSGNTRRSWHEDAFFGIHYDLHANENDTELGRELTTEHLVERLRRVNPDWIQCDCKGHAGFTSWPTKVGYTSPGVVNDSMRIHREATRELGIPLGMHYSGVWDSEAVAHHPEWARIDEHGVADFKDMRGPLATSRMSGYTTEFMIPQMLELIDEYDIDGFWVDGENWASKPDWSDASIAEFTRRTSIEDIPRKPGDAHWREWLDFHRDLFVEHVTTYANAIHERKSECLVVSNWMYTMRQPDPIVAPVDYLSGDFEYRWGADRAAVEGRLLDSRDISWDLMAWGFTKSSDLPKFEDPWILKSATQLSQEVAECVALGGAVMIYDTPQRTGHLTDWHQDTIGEVARFCRARKEPCFKSESRSQVAVLHPHADYYAKVNGTYNARDINHPIEGALHSLLELHYSTDVLTEDSFLRHADRYKLLVLPERSQVTPETHAAIESFVQEGGHLLISGATAASDFPEWTGATPTGDPIEGWSYLPVAQRAIGITGPWQAVTPGPDVEVWNTLMKQQEQPKDITDNAVIVHRQMGEGTVTSLHGNIFRDYLQSHSPLARTFIGSLIDRLGIEWEVEVDGPPILEVVTRSQGDLLVINLINRGAGETLSPHRVQFEDLPAIENVGITVQCETRPSTVSLQPSLDPLPWSWADGILTIKVPSIRIHDIVVIA
jgi:hypothetical protein